MLCTGPISFFPGELEKEDASGGRKRKSLTTYASTYQQLSSPQSHLPAHRHLQIGNAKLPKLVRSFLLQQPMIKSTVGNNNNKQEGFPSFETDIKQKNSASRYAMRLLPRKQVRMIFLPLISGGGIRPAQSSNGTKAAACNCMAPVVPAYPFVHHAKQSKCVGNLMLESGFVLFNLHEQGAAGSAYFHANLMCCWLRISGKASLNRHPSHHESLSLALKESLKTLRECEARKSNERPDHKERLTSTSNRTAFWKKHAGSRVARKNPTWLLLQERIAKRQKSSVYHEDPTHSDSHSSSSLKFPTQRATRPWAALPESVPRPLRGCAHRRGQHHPVELVLTSDSLQAWGLQCLFMLQKTAE